jgi:hypothetical protein
MQHHPTPGAIEQIAPDFTYVETGRRFPRPG